MTIARHLTGFGQWLHRLSAAQPRAHRMNERMIATGSCSVNLTWKPFIAGFQMRMMRVRRGCCECRHARQSFSLAVAMLSERRAETDEQNAIQYRPGG